MGFRNQFKNRRDANEPDIVAAFLAQGCTVERMDAPVDLAVGHRGRTYFVEVKTAKGGLTAPQEAFFARWGGHAEVVRTVEDVADCLRRWAE